MRKEKGVLDGKVALVTGDPAVKLEALESVVPPKLRSGRFKASDKLIAWLEAATFDQKAVKMTYWPGMLEAGSA
jgi:hypothetical protein